MQVHQPRFGVQSHPHAGAGLLHADRGIPRHSVQLLLQRAAQRQVTVLYHPKLLQMGVMP